LDFLHRNAHMNIRRVSHLSGPKSIPLGTDSRDPVVPVYHHHTPAVGLLANCII
jgi:hypothetical protein